MVENFKENPQHVVQLFVSFKLKYGTCDSMITHFVANRGSLKSVWTSFLYT